MRNSAVPFKQLLRALLLAVPVLLLLGLNGRTVTVVRPGTPAGPQASALPKGAVIKQRVALEAASPLAHYVAPTLLAWLPAVVPAAWPLHLLRRAVIAAPRGASAAFVAQLCRQRLLAPALWAQAP